MAKQNKNSANSNLGLAMHYYNKLIPIKNILSGITKRSRYIVKNPNGHPPFDDLYSLLCNKSLLIQALGNIEKNKGRLTAGVDSKTIDAISSGKIDDLAQKIKDGTFRFSATKRKWIPKLKLYKAGEKKKNRPLGIPTFTDRIVQEAIRLILEAIYEPMFEEHNHNFGFRPGYGCHHAISKIKREGTGCITAIEGDIEGAYDNVNHRILIKILEKKISDKKFLKFIYQGFKSGILDQGNKTATITGVPQGGIASPILFNIYMHEFDSFIQNELKKKVDEINKREGRIKKPPNNTYNNLDAKIQRRRKKLKEIKKNRPYIKLSEPEKIKYQNILKDKKQLVMQRTRTPSLRMDRREIKLIYIRYADDWLILTTGLPKRATELKLEIEKWLKENLKLTLSPAKTKITNLRQNPATFLGFSLRTYSRRRVTKSNLGELERTAGWNMIIDIDKNRYLEKMVLKGFCNLRHKPIAKSPWVVLNPEEIITRYNYIIRGIANYYLPVIDRLSYFQYMTYILKFSCLSTFAKKYSTKITKISQKYGDPLTITIKEQKFLKKLGTTSEVNRTFTLLSYLAIKEEKKYKKFDWSKMKFISVPEENLFQAMDTINWRTYKNLENVCCICGTNKDVEQHHIKHIRKGKVVGFSQVMKQLNRKTIPLCKTHHLEVHNGQYDNIKLTDLVGIERFLL